MWAFPGLVVQRLGSLALLVKPGESDSAGYGRAGLTASEDALETG